MEIKVILTELRKTNKKTQREVADYLGMSITGYASWEQGLAEPNLTSIRKLCKYYDISADYILGLKNHF